MKREKEENQMAEAGEKTVEAYAQRAKGVLPQDPEAALMVMERSSTPDGVPNPNLLFPNGESLKETLELGKKVEKGLVKEVFPEKLANILTIEAFRQGEEKPGKAESKQGLKDNLLGASAWIKETVKGKINLQKVGRVATLVSLAFSAGCEAINKVTPTTPTETIPPMTETFTPTKTQEPTATATQTDFG